MIEESHIPLVDFAEDFEGHAGSALASFDQSCDGPDDQEYLHHSVSLGPFTLYKGPDRKAIPITA